MDNGTVRYGRVAWIDVQSNSGVIQDQHGREYYFHAEECGGNLPPKYATVTFIRDFDYLTPVASMVRIDQLPPGNTRTNKTN